MSAFCRFRTKIKIKIKITKHKKPHHRQETMSAFCRFCRVLQVRLMRTFSICTVVGLF
jgi:hypothetical protein